MNNISLLGRLTKDPELKKSSSDLLFCNFSLAVNKIGKKDEADFFNCVAFGKTAELIEKYCKKGNQLAVTGSMTSNKKDDKIYWSVSVSGISLIGSSQQNNNSEETPKKEVKREVSKNNDVLDDDDVFPF